ncbi:MAG: hypothetical protein HY816_22840 [Candidatus Wallbacteria bacterium]|nr:hypothetical protein [Candidatus Wallbacteria bacterium]
MGGSRRARGRDGFGFWVIVVVLILMILAGVGIASYSQNQQLNRSIVEAYLGRVAIDIAGSAIEEAHWRMTRHVMTPLVDSSVTNDWDALLVEVPGPGNPSEVISPRMTRRVFEATPARPLDFTVEDIEDVGLTLVHREFDFAHGFWCGALEYETAVRLRMGRFPAGVAVTRRLRVRKRYYATQISATQSPVLRFMPEDLSREVGRL